MIIYDWVIFHYNPIEPPCFHLLITVSRELNHQLGRSGCWRPRYEIPSALADLELPRVVGYFAPTSGRWQILWDFGTHFFEIAKESRWETTGKCGLNGIYSWFMIAKLVNIAAILLWFMILTTRVFMGLINHLIPGEGAHILSITLLQ